MAHSQSEPDLTLHPFLRYYQHEVVEGHCTSILWDLREAPLPSGVRLVRSLATALAESDLMEPATTPPVRSLRVTCGFFPAPWSIMAIAQRGDNPVRGASSNFRIDGQGEGGAVTVVDVLSAIYACLQTQLTHEEWDQMSAKHQERVSAVFDARWRVALDPAATHAYGVLRVDCLLRYTWFGGLSVISRSVTEYGEGCILSLRQPR